MSFALGVEATCLVDETQVRYEVGVARIEPDCLPDVLLRLVQPSAGLHEAEAKEIAVHRLPWVSCERPGAGSRLACQ